MDREWLEWLRIANDAQLQESLATRRLLLDRYPEKRNELLAEKEAITAEIERRNGK